MTDLPSAFAEATRCNLAKQVRFAPAPIVYSSIPWRWMDEDDEGPEVIEIEDEPEKVTPVKRGFRWQTILILFILILAMVGKWLPAGKPAEAGFPSVWNTTEGVAFL